MLPIHPSSLPQFWSAYVPCDTQYKDAVRQTLEQIDVVHRMCQKYPDVFMFASSSDGRMALLHHLDLPPLP